MMSNDIPRATRSIAIAINTINKFRPTVETIKGEINKLGLIEKLIDHMETLTFEFRHCIARVKHDVEDAHMELIPWINGSKSRVEMFHKLMDAIPKPKDRALYGIILNAQVPFPNDRRYNSKNTGLVQTDSGVKFGYYNPDLPELQPFDNTFAALNEYLDSLIREIYAHFESMGVPAEKINEMQRLVK
jgi:hypothetical protein